MSKLQDSEENIPPSTGLLSNQEFMTVPSGDRGYFLPSLSLGLGSPSPRLREEIEWSLPLEVGKDSLPRCLAGLL